MWRSLLMASGPPEGGRAAGGRGGGGRDPARHRAPHPQRHRGDHRARGLVARGAWSGPWWGPSRSATAAKPRKMNDMKVTWMKEKASKVNMDTAKPPIAAASARHQNPVVPVVAPRSGAEPADRPAVEPEQREHAQGADLDQQPEPLVVEDAGVHLRVLLARQPGAEARTEEGLLGELLEPRAEIGHTAAARLAAALLLGDDPLLGEDRRLEGAERARHRHLAGHDERDQERQQAHGLLALQPEEHDQLRHEHQHRGAGAGGQRAHGEQRGGGQPHGRCWRW